MSIQAVAWAIEQDLPARPKLVLVSIANHANHVDGYCWLKASTIAKEAACTPRSVYTFIGGLVRNGFIRKALRRSEDGKQRANDYWILFDRAEAKWDWGAHPDEDVAEDDSAEIPPSEPDDTISGGGVNGLHSAEIAEQTEHHDTRQPVNLHVPSPGPSEASFTHKRIAEPSKTNPNENRAGARVRDAALRSYRPPPPQPLGATIEGPAKQIFVYEGSRAYDAWATHMARQGGTRSWHLVTRKNVGGQWKSGWYFASLFPPDIPPPTGLTDAEAKEFSDTG